MLVSVEELTNYMDIKLSPKAMVAAGYILDGLESELEQYLGRPIGVEEFTETYKFLAEPGIGYISNSSGSYSLPSVQTPYSYTLRLRNSPVTVVTAVYLARYGAASATLAVDTDYGVRRFGVDIWFPAVNDEYTVTYSAGLDPDKYKVLRLTILRAASREMQNMHDDNAGIQDLEGRQAAVAQTGFLESELSGVKRLRRQRI